MINKIDKNRIKELREQNYTLQEIANKFDVTRQRISQIFKDYLSLKPKMRQDILDFWQNKCGDCGSKMNLEVHHINGDRRDNRMGNVIALCKNCHLEIERRLFRNGLKIRDYRRKRIYKIPLVSSDCYRKFTFYPKTCKNCNKSFICHHHPRIKIKEWSETPIPENRKFCSQKCHFKFLKKLSTI